MKVGPLILNLTLLEYVRHLTVIRTAMLCEIGHLFSAGDMLGVESVTSGADWLTSITNLNPTSPTFKLRLASRRTKMTSPASQHQPMLPLSKPCAIMTLPNELLRESLSYLIPIGVWGLVDDATRRNFFSLRSVCRTFRWP
jgi:hypothetical protein